MQMPTAFIMAVRAVEDEFAGARPAAPVVEDGPAHRFLRTRAVVSRALYASARLIAPPEAHPATGGRPAVAECATGAY